MRDSCADATHKFDIFTAENRRSLSLKSSICPRGHPGLRIDSWPDKENRESSEIDAISGAFAFEHTSVDTLPNQRQDADIALMNDQKMLEAIRRAYPDGLPIGVDELWYADTAIPDDINFTDFIAMLGGSAAQQHG